MNSKEAISILKNYNDDIKGKLYRPASGILRYPYLMAGCKAYTVFIDWDAIWGGVYYLLEGDADPLKNSLYNLIDHIGPDGKGQRRINPDPPRYSAPAFQIRPFLATACRILCDRIGQDWLSDIQLEKVHHYINYFYFHRTGRQGLLKWLDVDEGFADNGLCNWAIENNAVEAADLNAQLYREHLALAKIYKTRGNRERTEYHQDKANRLKLIINAVLWDEDTSFYYSSYNPPERFEPNTLIKVLGYNNLWPLWTGIAPKERAERVIETYLLSEEHLLSPYGGVRSMSASDPYYNNMTKGYILPIPGAPRKGPMYQAGSANWQGPVWAPATFAGILTLKRYGYEKEARKMSVDFIVFLAKSLQQHGCYYENYHGDTGEPLACSGNASWYLHIPHLPDLLDAEQEVWDVEVAV